MSAFDWPGLMRAGICGLGLRPAEFWALTPAELGAPLPEPHPSWMTRIQDDWITRYGSGN